MGRGLIFLLAASVGLNIFGIGFFSGRILAGDPPGASQVTHEDNGRSGRRGSRGADDPFRLMRHAEVLPDEQREKFRDQIRSRLPAMRGSHQEVRELRRELNVLMAADDWDGAAIRAKLDEIANAQKRQRDALNTAFFDALSMLPTEDRKALMEAAQRDRGKRRRHGRSGPDGKRHERPRPE